MQVIDVPTWLDWVALTPLLAAMVVTAVLPGYFWVRTSIRSSVVAVAFAPALTLAVITVISVVWHAVGIPFSRATVLPALAVVAAGGAAVFWWRRRTRPILGEALGDHLTARPPLAGDSPSSHTYRILTRRERAALWALVGLGWVVAALAMVAAADPADPVQQWDSTFHMNGVWNILQTQQAQPNGGLAPLYDGRQVTYPIAWHAFTALFSTTGTVVQASNTMSLLIMGLWVAGGAAFTAVVSTSRTAVLAAPVIAGCLPNMPADALTMYNQWPNALGVALLPGLASVAVVLGRRLQRSTVSGLAGILPHLPLAGLFLLGGVGAVAAHPSAAFSLYAILVAPLLAGLWTMVRRSVWLGDRVTAVTCAVVAVLVVAAPLWLLTTEKLRAMGRYPRNGISWLEAFSHFLTPYPPFHASIGLGMVIAVMAVLLVLGAGATILAARSWNSLAEHAYPDLRRPFTYALPRESAADSVAQPIDEGGPVSVPPIMDEGGPTSVKLTMDEGDPGSVEPAGGAAAEPPPSSSDPDAGLPTAGVPVGDSRAELTQAWIERREAIRQTFGPRPLLWPIASYLVMAGLTFLAYSPDSALREFLLAPWYMDPRRIMAAQDLTLIPLAALGFEFAVNWLRAKRVRRADEHATSSGLSRIGVLLGAWLLAMTLVGALDARMWAVRYVYDTDALGKPGMATTGELAMIRRMPQTLPEDALVLGDPIAGAAYTEIIGQRRAVFPQLYRTLSDPHDEAVLTEHFNEIHTNPEVCEVVRRRGITHFYQDSDGYYYQSLRSDRTPGLYEVDTSTGFELVDQGDEARLYRITACDAE